MFIDKNSIKVNGANWGSFLVEAKYGYNKLWAGDSGRNLAGTQSGTLLGIFPKIIMQFRSLTKEELTQVTRVLDAPSQTLTYFDPNKNQTITITTYTGDYEITNRNVNKNEGFTCSFISTRKRK